VIVDFKNETNEKTTSSMYVIVFFSLMLVLNYSRPYFSLEHFRN